jgi:hypothetical protein
MVVLRLVTLIESAPREAIQRVAQIGRALKASRRVLLKALIDYARIVDRN